MTDVTQDPDPCDQGGTVAFNVDTTNLHLPVTVTIKWSPNGPETTHTITDQASATWTEPVPEDAEGGILSGDGFQDFAIAVAP